MVHYRKTITKNKPEYMNKKLLLTNASRNGLFRTEDGAYIQIKVNAIGKLFVHQINSNFQQNSC